MRIGIIDYGSGNIAAIQNILHELGADYISTADISLLESADKLILPGVGAYDHTMTKLDELELRGFLNHQVLARQVPILGICVGMQILGNRSEEGQSKGLGWIPGHVGKLDTSRIFSKPLLPHLGWNSVSIHTDSPLFANVALDRGFYFLHSYRFYCDSEDFVVATSFYGEAFPCVVQKDNIYGIQFHPEKSHSNGVSIFKNYLAL